MGFLLALLFLWSQDESGFVTLADGSRFAARLRNEPIVLRTQYGDLTIPLKEVRSIRLKDGEHQVRTVRLAVVGKLTAEEFSFDTDFGKIKVPAREIASLHVGRGGAPASDDRTAAFWSFDDPDAIDAVSDRPVTMVDAAVTDESGGFKAFVRKNENSYAQGSLPDGYRLSDGPFTLEVRVKVGAMTRSYATLLAVNEEGNAYNRDFWFLVQNGGQLYFDSGDATTTHFVSQTAAVVDLNQWTYIALVYDPAAPEIRHYVNGKKVHTDSGTKKFHKSSGPLFLGPGGAGKAFFSCPERFQFARVSKAALSDEEISDWQKRLEGETGFFRGSAARGVAFRNGGFLKAEVPALGQAKFRTRFGVLEVKSDLRGRIDLYPLREKEIEALQPEIARLIEDLADPSIVKREEAQKSILELGGAALSLLRNAKNSTDPEVQARVQALLDKFEQSGVTRRPIHDQLRLGRTVLHGWLEISEIEAVSKYGTFRFNLRSVGSISLAEPDPAAAGPLIRLRSGETVEGDPRGSTISLETEFGILQVPLKDVLSFKYDDATKQWTVKTEKATLTGTVTGDKITLATPAGPIAVPLSETAEFGK